MSGIVFFGSRDLGAIRDFYIGRVGMEVWLEQSDCIILKHGNMLLGFCQREKADTQGIITFYYLEKADVDLMYSHFKDSAFGAPKENAKYGIYHFFCTDPEGRKVEFQRFLDQPSSSC